MTEVIIGAAIFMAGCMTGYVFAVAGFKIAKEESKDNPPYLTIPEPKRKPGGSVDTYV